MTATIATTREYVASRPRTTPVPIRRRFGRADVVSVLSMLAVIAFAYFQNVARYSGYGDDEGTYTAQAWAVQHGGLAHYTYWYDHPPIGWTQLALFSWLPQMLHLGGSEAVGNTRYVIVGYMLAAAVLMYVIARRMGVHRVIAAVGITLFFLSPIPHHFLRLVFLDNIALPWLLGAFALALTPRRGLWHYAFAGLAFAIAVLSKETLLLFAPALLWAIWVHCDIRLRAMNIMALATASGAAILAYPLFAALRHELMPGPGHVSLWEAITFQFANREGSGNVFTPGSHKNDLVQYWFGFDRALVYVGLAAALLLLVGRKERWLPIAILGWALPVLKPGGYMPSMYIISVLPFLGLALVVVADRLVVLAQRLPHVRSRPRERLLAALVVVAALVMSVVYVTPGWAKELRVKATVDNTAPQREATQWMRDHAARDTVVLVDDSYWLDIVRAGWQHPNLPTQWQVVWFYKFDLDPDQSLKYLPAGWKDVDYMIVSPQMRSDTNGTLNLKKIQAVVTHSKVVATFGSNDEDLVEIRQVVGGN